MAKIVSIAARQVFDSRGNPTVEADVVTAFGCGRASVPSGASTGKHEALELRDGRAYGGMGVQKAVKNVNTVIAPKLVNQDALEQAKLDKLMCALDGTPNKSRLGANAILAVSLALCRAAALEEATPLYQYIAHLAGNEKFVLPIPAFNIINGGKHASNKLDIQEYQLLPVRAKSFSEAMQIGTEVYHKLKQLLLERYGKSAINVGDEGGFAPQMACFEEPFDFILDAVNELGYWNKIKLGIDAAATTFYSKGKYYLEGNAYTPDQLLEKYLELANSYPLISIEDPFHEDDFKNFALLNKNLKQQVVGDDLTVTNPRRIKRAIAGNSCNCLLLKVNQIGTLTEALQSAQLAIEHGWNVMVSHRSGETTDAFIADLAVGLGATQIKSGAPCRGERLSKYNRLLQIEEELGARYASYP